MKKIFSILICVFLISPYLMAGTEHTVETGVDNSAYGWIRSVGIPKITMSDNNDIYITYNLGNEQSYTYSIDSGATWTFGSANMFVGTYNGEEENGMFMYKDTMYSWSTNLTSSDFLTIGKFYRGSRLFVDTIDGVPDYQYGLFQFGLDETNAHFWSTFNAPSDADYKLYSYSPDLTLDATDTWVTVDSFFMPGADIRVPVANGVFVLGLGNDSVFFLQPETRKITRDLAATNFNLESATMFRLNPSILSTGPTRGTEDKNIVWFTWVQDDSIKFTAWKIDLTDTTVSLYIADTVIDVGDRKPHATSEAEQHLIAANPNLTMSKVDSTLYLFYKIWDDTTDWDSHKVVYRSSSDLGVTWSAETTIKEATGADSLLQLITPPYINSNIIALAYSDTLGAGYPNNLYVYIDTLGAAAPTLTQSWTVVDTNNTSVKIENNYANPNGTVDFLRVIYGTVNDITDAGRDSVSVSAGITDPDTLEITGLTANTEYYFWGMLQDDDGIDTIAVDSITTLQTVSHSVTVYDTNSTSFYIEDDYTANNVNIFRLYYHTSRTFSDPGLDSVSVTVGITDPDSLGVTGLTASTEYFFWVALFDQLGRDTTGIDSITTLVEADVTDPDPFDAFEAITLINITPDSAIFSWGAVDSADYDQIMIRYSTTAVPANEAAGTQLYNASGGLENVIDTFEFTVTEPTWVYFSIFAGDEVPNWSTGIADSFYVPEGGGSTVTGRINRMYEYLMGLQTRVMQDD